MDELTPLQVLLSVMRDRWKVHDYEGAVALAKLAAPYLHGKAPAAVPMRDLAGATDEELERFEGEGGACLPGRDSGEPA